MYMLCNQQQIAIIISQYKSSILVITQVQDEAKDTKILYEYWSITDFYST